MADFDTGLEKDKANFTALTPIDYLVRTAEVYPDKLAIVYGNIRRTWKETYDRCRRLASALKQLGVSGDNAVYVGDSDVDLATARNSGLPCISVLWGFRDRDFLLDHGATTFITSPKELLD